MTMKHFFLSLILLASLAIPPCFAQVGDIKKEVKEEKKRKESSGESNSSEISEETANVILQLFQFAFYGVAAAQQSALQGKDVYPQRVSLEVPLSFGAQYNESEQGKTPMMGQAGARLNWGIFATDFRYIELDDGTDRLPAFDWIVGIVRIPIKGFVPEYGLGFTRLTLLDQSFFKQTLGFDWRISESNWNLAAGYQWTEKLSTGARFKENVYIRLDYALINSGAFHISPLLEYSYQDYFDQVQFNMLSLGVVARIY